MAGNSAASDFQDDHCGFIEMHQSHYCHMSAVVSISKESVHDSPANCLHYVDASSYHNCLCQLGSVVFFLLACAVK